MLISPHEGWAVPMTRKSNQLDAEREHGHGHMREGFVTCLVWNWCFCRSIFLASATAKFSRMTAMKSESRMKLQKAKLVKKSSLRPGSRVFVSAHSNERQRRQ